MAHFAQLDNDNKVINVIVVDNDVTHDADGVEQEALGIAFCKQLFGEDTKWIQTSFNNNFRNVYAGIGYVYLPEKDIFLPEQPYPSWIAGDTKWLPPIPEPEPIEGIGAYRWDEDSQSWLEPEAPNQITTGE